MLGIAATNDERLIKRAYAQKLRLTRPDEDADAYQRLAQAFELALDQARGGYRRVDHEERLDDEPHSLNPSTPPLGTDAVPPDGVFGAATSGPTNAPTVERIHDGQPALADMVDEAMVQFDLIASKPVAADGPDVWSTWLALPELQRLDVRRAISTTVFCGLGEWLTHRAAKMRAADLRAIVAAFDMVFGWRGEELALARSVPRAIVNTVLNRLQSPQRLGLPSKRQLVAIARAIALGGVSIVLSLWLVNDTLSRMRSALSGTTQPASSAEATVADEFTQAVRELDAAIARDPRDVAALVERSLLHWRSSYFELAMADVDAAIVSDSANVAALVQRGIFLAYRGESALALRDLEHAVRYEPQNSAALNALAWHLSTSSNPEDRDGVRALSLAREAHRHDQLPKGWVADTLAAAYAETGDFSAAVQMQRQAMEALAPASERSRAAMQQRFDLYLRGQPYRRQPRDDGK